MIFPLELQTIALYPSHLIVKDNSSEFTLKDQREMKGSNHMLTTVNNVIDYSRLEDKSPLDWLRKFRRNGHQILGNYKFARFHLQ